MDYNTYQTNTEFFNAVALFPNIKSRPIHSKIFLKQASKKYTLMNPKFKKE